MEYICNILNKIYCILKDPMFLSEYVDIIVNIITGVVLISGLKYLKPLKEKTISSTFNFWAQLKIYLEQLSLYISCDVGVLDNLYSSDSRKNWDILSPDDSRIEEFKSIVNEALNFLKRSPDQMPAYNGWSKDYGELIKFLNDVIVFDVCNNDQHFKFYDEKTLEERNKYAKEIQDLIQKMHSGIAKKQESIESQLFVSRVFKKK